MKGPLKNKKSQQILPKSRNLAQPSNGSRSLRFCVCQSHSMEPQYNEVPRDCKNYFIISEFHYKRNPDITKLPK